MKKLGKAKIDLERGLWYVESKPEHFHMNRRLVDTRPDVKKFMNKFRKEINQKRPSKRQPLLREQYFKERSENRRQKTLFWTRVYKDIYEESFVYPLPLRLDHDFDHKSDWRYGMYQGIIYFFDKPDLSDEAMIREINAFEGRNAPPDASAAAGGESAHV